MRLKAKALELKKEPGLFSTVLKGAVFSLCVSLIGVLCFAFLLKFTNISEKLVTPVNEVIKGISIFLGVFLGFKRERKYGLLGGLLIGILFTLFAFLSFSILGGGFSFDLTFLYDLIFGGILGAICGVICVNLKKSSN